MTEKITEEKNKILSILKVFLGVVVISFFHVFSLSFPDANFFVKILLAILFWSSVSIFMDWREWVK